MIAGILANVYEHTFSIAILRFKNNDGCLSEPYCGKFVIPYHEVTPIKLGFLQMRLVQVARRLQYAAKNKFEMAATNKEENCCTLTDIMG